MPRATRYKLRATRHVLRTTCYVLGATCYMLCYMLHATIYKPHDACYMLHAVRTYARTYVRAHILTQMTSACRYNMCMLVYRFSVCAEVRTHATMYIIYAYMYMHYASCHLYCLLHAEFCVDCNKGEHRNAIQANLGVYLLSSPSWEQTLHTRVRPFVQIK